MIRNIFIVMRGTVLAQGLGFIALPFLTRLLDPSAFGHFQIYQSILIVLLVLPTLRYEVAILRADGSDELRALVQLCLGCILIVTAIAASALGLLRSIGWPPELALLPFPLWLVAAGLLFGGLAQFMALLMTREQAFSASANSKIVQSLSYVASALSIGAIAPIPATLVIADIVSRIVNAVYLSIWTAGSIRWIWRPTQWQAVRRVAIRYREYPFVSLPGTLINVIGGILTPFMIYATFEAAASGQYALLERSVALPLGLVVVSVSQVFTSQFAASFREKTDDAVRSFNRIVRLMAIGGSAPMLLLMVAGPHLFALLFGEEWRTAGELARIMAPAYLSMLIVGTVNMVVTIVGYQKTQTAWEVFRLASMAGLWIAIPRLELSLEQAVMGHSIVTVACNVGFLLLAIWTLRHASSDVASRSLEGRRQ